MRVAEEQGWPDIVANSLCEEGIVLHRMGESERGWKRLRKAEKSATKIGDETLLARVLNGQGDLLITQGRLDEATQAFAKVRSLAAQNGHTEQEADSHFQLGRTCKQAGRLTDARDHLSLSIELFESIGARWGLAKAVNELGEICRLENQLGEAGRYYRLALEKMDELGLAEATIPRLNLALVMLQQGKYEEAQPLIAHAHAQFTRSGSKSRLSLTHLLSLVCETAQGIWIDWDYHLSQARVLLADLDLWTSISPCVQRRRANWPSRPVLATGPSMLGFGDGSMECVGPTRRCQQGPDTHQRSRSTSTIVY